MGTRCFKTIYHCYRGTPNHPDSDTEDYDMDLHYQLSRMRKAAPIEKVKIAAIYDPKALNRSFYNKNCDYHYDRYRVAIEFIDDINKLLLFQRKLNKYKLFVTKRKSIDNSSKELRDKYKNLKKQFEAKHGKIFLNTVEFVILKDGIYGKEKVYFYPYHPQMKASKKVC